MTSRVAVIGGGVGGLSAAIRLAASGADVELFERGSAVGGKMREVAVGERKLDAGPSVLTMPWIFEELFQVAGRRLRDHLTLLPVEPACRHFFPDGSRLDLSNDPERSRAAIRDFAGERAAAGFDALRKNGARIYEIVRGPFMESPIPSLGDMLKMMWMLPAMMQIDAGRTLWRALESFLPNDSGGERLRVLFGRYATYNGSSPFHCPATLAVIAHVEQAFGIHAVRGGLYRLAEALADVARSLGVRIHTDAHVERITVSGDAARGVVVGGQNRSFDAVVANCDAAQLFDRLLDGQGPAQKLGNKLRKCEPSFSAYVLLVRASVGEFPLVHHNVFFSRDYRREFDQLIEKRRPPDDPTVYLCAQDRVPESPAPDDGQERHLILTNAPALDEKRPIDWNAEGPKCRSRLLEALSRYRLTLSPTAEQPVLPTDLERMFPLSRGSIYGASSNAKMAAFDRPQNRVPGYRGLYLVGGSAHPGAGLPMVALSAKIATRLLAEELKLGPHGSAPRKPPAVMFGGTSTP